MVTIDFGTRVWSENSTIKTRVVIRRPLLRRPT